MATTSSLDVHRRSRRVASSPSAGETRSATSPTPCWRASRGGRAASRAASSTTPVARSLFEEITALDEYYPTRVETALLEAHGAEIAAR